MKKFLYGLVCVTSLVSLQGCFYHSTERDVVVPAGQNSTTVVSPQASTTTTTTTNP